MEMPLFHLRPGLDDLLSLPGVQWAPVDLAELGRHLFAISWAKVAELLERN